MIALNPEYRALLVPKPGAEETQDLLTLLRHYLIGLNFKFHVSADDWFRDKIEIGQEEIVRSKSPNYGLGEVSLVEERLAQKHIDKYDYVFITKPLSELDRNWARVLSPVNCSRVVDVSFRESAGIENRLAEIAGDLRGLETSLGTINKLSTELRRLRESTAESILVGTGPSARDVLNIDMNGKSAIICNTVILDEEVMEHLKPEFLCFSDPAYHFGPSAYAKEFRNRVRETARLFPSLKILTIRRYHDLLEIMVPELAGRILSVDTRSRNQSLNLDLDLAPFVRAYPNILTLLMLPLAASFSKKISLFGFDGRSAKESKFWSHGSSVQLNALLDEHQEFHSGFHSIDYDKYFSEHCQQVEEVVCAIEQKRIVVESANPSSIPALAKRHNKGSRDGESRASQTIISVCPAWRSSFGHYEAWNRALYSSAREHGFDFKALANHEFTDVSRPEWALPSLRFQSIKGQAAPDNETISFEELKNALTEFLQTTDNACTVFLYEGHPRDFTIWANLAHHFPETRFVLNIMWPEGGHGNFSNLKTQPKNLTVSGDNGWTVSFLASFLRNVTRLPHPAVGAAENLPKAPKKMGKLRRIVWPIHPFVERGHHELEKVVTFLADLIHDGTIEFVWRVPPQIRNAVELEEEINKLSSLGVNVLVHSENLSSDDFKKFLASFDLTVLPYPSLQRSSLLAIDSLASGTAVMTYEDNWVSKLGFSKQAIVSVPQSPDAIGRAIRFLVESDSIVGVSDDEHSEVVSRFSTKSLIRFLSIDEVPPLAFGAESERAKAELEALRRKRIKASGGFPDLAGHDLPYVDSPYPYELEVHMDEAKFVQKLLEFSGKANDNLKIVDVGAAKGSFFSTFIHQISHVWAIEPHPDRVKILNANYETDQRISVVQAAISSTLTGTLNLWDSDESWGVSTLQPWLQSHHAAHEVEVIKLSSLALPSEIDILKVDAEGHDLSVIQSLDWSRTNPKIVICEYDDQKLQVGESESWKPLVEFLEGKGFSILISEWYPIEKYGGNHRWRRMHVESEPNPGSWGNIIGIREEVLNYSTVLCATLASIEANTRSDFRQPLESSSSHESQSRAKELDLFATAEGLIDKYWPSIRPWLMRRPQILNGIIRIRKWLKRF